MNIKRIVTALIGSPIVIALLVFGNPILIDVIIAIIACRAIYEYGNCSKKECKQISWLAYIPAVLIAFIHIISKDLWIKIIPIIIPMFLLLGFLQIIITDGKTNFKDLSYTLSGSVYIVSLIMFFSLIYGGENGKLLIWYVFFSSWGSDTMAYIVGKNFGKHKFSKISPNKTIEGCLGGLLGAIIFCLVYTYIINRFCGMNLGYVSILIMACVLGIIGQIGDFAASTIKRYFDVKDFSNIFPGHGGMVDRIDSIIFIAPFAYYFLYILMG